MNIFSSSAIGPPAKEKHFLYNQTTSRQNQTNCENSKWIHISGKYKVNFDKLITSTINGASSRG